VQMDQLPLASTELGELAVSQGHPVRLGKVCMPLHISVC